VITEWAISVQLDSLPLDIHFKSQAIMSNQPDELLDIYRAIQPPDLLPTILTTIGLNTRGFT
jgi:hypothetical protein